MTTTLPHQMLPLGLLRRDERARVSQVLGESAQAQRLRELGLHPGAEVRMVQPGASCMLPEWWSDYDAHADLSCDR